MTMAIVFQTACIKETPLHYCPGCTHGIVQADCGSNDELDIEGNTIGVSPVGCAYNNYLYFNCDMVQAAHGRLQLLQQVLSVLTLKILFSIREMATWHPGTAEIVHAANRGEK